MRIRNHGNQTLNTGFESLKAFLIKRKFLVAVNYTERISLNRLQKVLYKIYFIEKCNEICLVFLSRNIKLHQDCRRHGNLFNKSASAWFRIVEGELDKFKIDPQTGEVSTIQVSLFFFNSLITFIKTYFIYLHSLT